MLKPGARISSRSRQKESTKSNTKFGARHRGNLCPRPQTNLARNMEIRIHQYQNLTSTNIAYRSPRRPAPIATKIPKLAPPTLPAAPLNGTTGDVVALLVGPLALALPKGMVPFPPVTGYGAPVARVVTVVCEYRPWLGALERVDEMMEKGIELLESMVEVRVSVWPAWTTVRVRV